MNDSGVWGISQEYFNKVYPNQERQKVKLSQLRTWYKEAVKYKNVHRFAAMVVELCLEVERLRQIADEENSEYSEYTRMPFGKEHKGKKLADVPRDFLDWWFRLNSDRDMIILEMDHGDYANRVAAKKKLRLHDYIKRMHNGLETNQERQTD